MNNISICISTFNRAKDLDKCLDSIVKQTYPFKEVIIVDNCSSDNTTEIVRSYYNKLDIQYYIMDSDKYSAMHTLNLAFQLSNYEYILVMDDDAYLYNNDAIKILVEDMDKNDNTAIIGSNIQHEVVQPPENYIFQMPIINIEGKYLSNSELNNLPLILYFEFHGACALFRKSMVSQVNFYDESFNIYLNEWDLSCKMLSLGYDVLFESRAIAKHVENNGKKSYKRSIQFIHNTNTVISRNFRKLSTRLTMIMIRTFLLYGFYMKRKFMKVDKIGGIFFTLLIIHEILRGLYIGLFPDQHNIFVREWFQSQMEKSFMLKDLNSIKSIFKKSV